MKVKAASNKTEFDWKPVGEHSYLYSVRTGKILGRVWVAEISANGSLHAAAYDSELLGDYVNEGYAKAAVLEAAALSVTKKILKRA